jgi:hypothetical protein
MCNAAGPQLRGAVGARGAASPRAARVVAAGALAVLGAAACSKASDEVSVRKAPQTPPPPQVPKASDDLSVPVIVDGVAVSPITGPELNDTKADYAAADRKGWHIGSLVELPAGPLRIVIDGSQGVSLFFEVPGEPPRREPALVPALLWNRRGHLIAAGVDPANPFPKYHGAGAYMQRLGDPQPRLVDVVRVRVERSGAGSPCPCPSVVR